MIEDTLTHRRHYRVEPGPRSELAANVADMVGHGVDADVKYIGNLLRGPPCRDPAQDLQLVVRERRTRRRRRVPS